MKQKFENYVSSHMGRLADLMGLHHWKINVRFEEFPEQADGFVSYGDTECHNRYHRATIRFSQHLRQRYEQGHLLDVQNTMIHELAHVVLAKLQAHGEAAQNDYTDDAFRDTVEQTTEHITRMVARLLPKGFFK